MDNILITYLLFRLIGLNKFKIKDFFLLVDVHGHFISQIGIYLQLHPTNCGNFYLSNWLELLRLSNLSPTYLHNTSVLQHQQRFKKLLLTSRYR